MHFENRPAAPVIEKTVYESNDCHYEVSPKKRVSSTLIQKIISIIFGLMYLEYGIVNTSNDTQFEIIRHTILYSNAKSDYVKFTYTNISGKCFWVAFTFTSTTYLQGSHETVKATIWSTDINKKFQLWELQLQIHVECETYADILSPLLLNIIKRLLHLIIILCYIRKNASINKVYHERGLSSLKTLYLQIALLSNKQLILPLPPQNPPSPPVPTSSTKRLLEYSDSTKPKATILYHGTSYRISIAKYS